MATEGTYSSKIYDLSFEKYSISYSIVSEGDEKKIRKFIEAVKQMNITSEIEQEFIEYINTREENVVVLGCTELPVLFRKCADRIDKKVYDPLAETIKVFKKAD